MQAATVIDAINTAPLNMGLDGTVWLSQPNHVAFEQDGDVVLFEHEGADIWQVHVLLKSRGRAALDVISDAFDFIFTEYGAQVLTGLAPSFRRDVKMIARWMGMRFARVIETEFGPCDMFVLVRDMRKVH